MAEPVVQPEMDPADDRFPGDKIVVGVDIGTTNSGIAFKHVRRNQQMGEVAFVEIPTVRGWPTSHGADRDESKVPSTLRYNASGEVTSWGYQFDDADGEDQVVTTAVEWFKLAIIPNKDLPSYLRGSPKLKETRDTLCGLKLKVVEVIEQYMKKIWPHALGKIAEALGRDFETTPIHVVLTVPAIWGHHAIEMMRVAAGPSILAPRGAFPTTYGFISEPEAAAEAYTKELQRKLNVGEIVVIVDLGGGTVDVISYIYTKNAQGEKASLQLEEAASGAGALCGAMFLDEAFEALLLSKLSAEYKKIKTEDPTAWRTLLSEQWQHSIKRNFEWESKSKGRKWPVTLSNVPRRKVDLDQDQIRDVFEDSVMPGILRLIRSQIEAVKKAHGKVPSIILPVGGFGRCPYILRRLRDEFNGDNVTSEQTKRGGNKRRKVSGPRIEVHSDPGEMPWTAISRGACISGMRAQLKQSLVTSRKCRTSVGFIHSVPGKQEQGAVWQQEFGCHVIPGVMRWVIKKASYSFANGDALTNRGEKYTLPMFLACDVDGKGTRAEHSILYTFDDPDPPSRYKLDDPKSKPDDPKFVKYGEITITATKPIEELLIEGSGAERRRVFYYNLQIKIVGGSVEITATSACPDDHGMEVGSVVLSGLEAK